MASKIGTPLGMFSVALIIIGLILIVIGFVFLIISQNNNTIWWMWLLFILGIVSGIIGCIILFFLIRSQVGCQKICSE